MSASAYRSNDAYLSERIAALRAMRATEAYAGAFLRARNVAAVRMARAAGAAAGTGVALVAFYLALLSAWGPESYSVRQEIGGKAVPVLLSGGPLAIAVFALALLVARASLPRSAEAVPPAPLVDAATLERLEQGDPLRAMRTLACRWEFAGAALPMIATTFLAPLTLHALVAAVLFRGIDGSFGELWMASSLVLTGHAHLTLAVAAAWWVRSFRRRAAVEVRLAARRSWAKAMLAVLVACAVPGAFLLGIPTIVAFVTTLAFVPAMYLLTARTLVRERGRLEDPAEVVQGIEPAAHALLRERILRIVSQRSEADYVAAFASARRAAVARVARASAGIAALAVILAPVGILGGSAFVSIHSSRDMAECCGIVTVALVFGWGFWLLSAPIAALTTHLFLLRRPCAPLSPPADPATELALLEGRGDPLQGMRKLAARWELPGALLPLLPLTLALLPAACLGYASRHGSLVDWPWDARVIRTCVGSVVIGGVAHLALLLVACWSAAIASRRAAGGRLSRLPRWWGPAFMLAVFMGIAPAVTAVATLFLPLS